MTRFRLDLVTVISISKLSVKTTSISLVSPNNSFPPTISKAMLAVTNLSSTLVRADKGRGQFPIVIGTNSYQNTYFIFFFTVFSYVFSLFSPVFQDLQNTPTEYNRIHCILNNTREYTQNTHRIHNVQKRRKVLFAQYTC